MEDDLTAPDSMRDPLVALDVPLDDLDLRGKALKIRAPSSRKVVEDGYPVAKPNQALGQMGADEATATGDQYALAANDPATSSSSPSPRRRRTLPLTELDASGRRGSHKLPRDLHAHRTWGSID